MENKKKMGGEILNKKKMGGKMGNRAPRCVAVHADKRPLVSKETYYSVKRDLL